jgi:outer membrane protein OmpA-like peptidoglycan-associated protein
MKSLLGSILVLSFLPVWSQNLIPNGNFENPFLPFEMQWKQPHGDYYHYYQDPKKLGDAWEGQFYNGICIYNHQENEFMQTALSQPLEEGRSYCLKTMARLLDVKSLGNEYHDKIGILFTSYPFSVEKPFFPGDSPENFWLIPDTINRMEWFPLETEYVANGTEKYLTIGYFMSLGISDYIKKQEFDFMLGNSKAKQEEPEKQAIPPPDFSKKGGKPSKKQEREMAEFRKSVMTQSDEHSTGSMPVDRRKIRFTLRYYLDDICLAPVLADGNCDCEPELPPVDLSEGATVRMENLLFESGKAVLKSESEYALEVLAGMMNANPAKEISIHGHTDNVGKDESNLLLSQERAKAVYDYLISVKVAPERLSFQGFGSTVPIADNDTETGRAKNRRVEFVILKQ